MESAIFTNEYLGGGGSNSGRFDSKLNALKHLIMDSFCYIFEYKFFVHYILDDYGPLPGFKQQPIDTLIEFTNQSVICGIRGSLPRTVSWLKDNKELDTTKQNHLEISKEGSLTLFNAQKDRDEGDYRCLVSNTFGSVFSRIAKVTFPCK